MECPALIRREVPRSLSGVDPGPGECLVRIDVANACDTPLVQEPGANRGAGAGEGSDQVTGAESVGKWLRAESLGPVSVGVRREDSEPPEASDVPIDEGRSIIQPEVKPGMLGERAWLSGSPVDESAGHSEIHDQAVGVATGHRSGSDLHDDVLAPAADAVDQPVPERGTELRLPNGEKVFLQHLDILNGAVEEGGTEPPDDRLSFR